jgi:hypothetical protein
LRRRDEDFGAQANSPQIACLKDVREADLVVLILGESYGAAQQSGLSATHEEYREARGRKPILAFVQRGIKPDAQQKEFLDEVQGWESGLFRKGFSGADDLQVAIIRALHQHDLAAAVAPVDLQDIGKRALAALPEELLAYFLERRGGYLLSKIHRDLSWDYSPNPVAFSEFCH